MSSVEIPQSHSLNLVPGYTAPLIIHCSQGDTGTKIYLTVKNGSTDVDLSNWGVTVHGVRQDGLNWGPNNCTYNSSNNTVCFTLDQSITGNSGACIAELTLRSPSNGQVIGTANFCILVEKGTFSNGVTFSNDVSVYQNILNYVIKEIKAIENSRDELINKANSYVTEAVNTWLTQNVSAGSNTLDKTLTLSGAAAEAKTVGDRFDKMTTYADGKFAQAEGYAEGNFKRVKDLEAKADEFDECCSEVKSTIESALPLTTTELLDQNGNIVYDQTGQPIYTVSRSAPVDATLKRVGIAADAKTVGDALRKQNTENILAEAQIEINKNNIQDLVTENQNAEEVAEDLDDRVSFIEKAFTTKSTEILLDQTGDSVLDSIGNPILVNSVDPVLNGSALASVEEEMFSPEKDDYWNVWGWSGRTVRIPILYLYGSLPKSKGDGKYKVTYYFAGINGMNLKGKGKVKVQGQSSAGLPKKNYNITFEDKFLAKDDWLPSKKYTFKSCWNDPTWARNAVSGRLWAQCVACRDNVSYSQVLDENGEAVTDENGDPVTTKSYPLDIYPNHGTYDGFPVYIIDNGTYLGLFTMLIAKDKDMFGIGIFDEYKDTECVVSNEGAGTGTAGGFKKANLMVDAESDEDTTGMSTQWTYECIPHEKPDPDDYDNGEEDEEYIDDLAKYEEDNTYFRKSLNTMIQAVVDSTGTDDKDTNYKKVSAQYLDYDSVVDYMIFSSLINAADDVGKNWLLVTYDGVKWFFSAYDMDTTWGNWCPDYNNPNLIWSPDQGGPTINSWDGSNRAMHMIYKYDPERLINRYEYLRSTVFSEENVYREFMSFIRKVPENAIAADKRLYRTEPNGMDFAQIENWYRLRAKAMDKQIETLKASLTTE